MMGSIVPKITKRIVDAFQPDGTAERFLWDSELKGFGVRMMPSGVGSYIVKYRTAENRQRKMTIGRIGTMTTEEARQLAREHLTSASKGGDPSSERKQLRKNATLSEVCVDYMAEAKTRLKPNSYLSNESNINVHILPLLGNRSVASITRADVTRMQTDIMSGKTAKNRKGRGGRTTGGSSAAHRATVMLGSILEHARVNGAITENVAFGVRKPKTKKQKRYLNDEEIKKLSKAIRDSNTESPAAKAAIRFLLLSGCRRMEVLSLPVKWIDRDNGCIRFDDTKTGAQIRPIGKSAFVVLDDVKPKHGWAFPSEHGEGHFVGLPKVLQRLCKAAKLEGVTIHVLRHTFASVAAGMGYSELTIAGLLGHSVPGVTARYAHVADSALVSAADAVSAKIAGMMGE